MKMQSISNRFFQLIISLAVLSSGLIPGQAFAGPSDNLPTVTVNYADLNLANPAGVRKLHSRIETAARSVCGRYFNNQMLELREASRNCYKTAVKTAMKKAKIEENLAQQ